MSDGFEPIDSCVVKPCHADNHAVLALLEIRYEPFLCSISIHDQADDHVNNLHLRVPDHQGISGPRKQTTSTSLALENKQYRDETTSETIPSFTKVSSTLAKPQHKLFFRLNSFMSKATLRDVYVERTVIYNIRMKKILLIFPNHMHRPFAHPFDRHKLLEQALTFSLSLLTFCLQIHVFTSTQSLSMKKGEIYLEVNSA